MLATVILAGWPVIRKLSITGVGGSGTAEIKLPTTGLLGSALLLVSQGFDGIEARGAEGRDHAADQSNRGENQGRGDQRSRRND